jgi:hypothetical protein
MYEDLIPLSATLEMNTGFMILFQHPSETKISSVDKQLVHVPKRVSSTSSKNNHFLNCIKPLNINYKENLAKFSKFVINMDWS